MPFAQELSMQPGALDVTQLARDYYTVVFRFCARRVGMDLAADTAQDTFVTAQRVLAKFAGKSDLKTWLLGIAHNECRRQSRIRKTLPLPVEFEQTAAGDAETSLVDRHTLREAMAKLSPEHREVVLLHEIEGLSYEEAAAVLGVPAGTVKSRLHHAFLNLRKSLLDPPGGLQ